ncbi:MAG: hypothetical protein JXR37_22715 [Kiritimatiellae bacterium]|nr:hypothetical protein [Kiritimatiellia bacterium]
MNQDWNIKARGHACSGCQTAFADGQPYYSRLRFGEEGYERADFCEPCWQQQEQEGAHLSSWRGTYRPPPPAPEPALKKETAESLFRKLIEEEDRTQRNTVYILGVMLERRRILVERDIRTLDNGDRVLVYEHRKSGETFLVADPQLRLDQLEHVQEEVVTMLGGRKPGESAPEEAASEQPPSEPDAAAPAAEEPAPGEQRATDPAPTEPAAGDKVPSEPPPAT